MFDTTVAVPTLNAARTPSPGLLVITSQWLRAIVVSLILWLVPLCVFSAGQTAASTTTNVRSAANLPSVLSINLCADQLVLLLAEPAQIKALSSLSHDMAGSYFHELARGFAKVDVSAEQILPYTPDVVLTGPYVSRYTLSLLDELGLRVESLAIANSIDTMLENVIRVGDILNRQSAATRVVTDVRRRLEDIGKRVEKLDLAMADAGHERPRAAVYDPNGYTVGQASMRGEAIVMAGWHNVASDRGIESYGVLALEDMIQLRPDALIESPYSAGTYSRGQMLTRHPALRQAGVDPLIVPLASNQTICAGPWSVDNIERLVNARESKIR